MMLRSVLPPFAYVFLFLDLALVIQLGLWKTERYPCHCGSFQRIGPGCSSFFTYLEAVCGEQRLHHKEFLPPFFSQIIMASSSPIAHTSCSCDHSPTLFTLSRRSTQVPVDQESGSRIWDLQLTCQGAFIPS